jgi:hypothetical protein
VPDLYGLGDDAYLSGTGPGSSIWPCQRKLGETGLYLGLACDRNAVVDAAYTTVITAGGPDAGQPADRTYVAPGYYARKVADFDGNRLEFVHNAWNPARSQRPRQEPPRSRYLALTRGAGPIRRGVERRLERRTCHRRRGLSRYFWSLCDPRHGNLTT